MRTLMVVLVAAAAAFSITALVAACDVASTASDDDAGGGGGGGGDTGVTEDAGGGKSDTGGGADAGAPDDAGTGDDTGAGDDAGTGDDTGTIDDGGGQDAGPQAFTFAGTVTIEGKKPKNLAVAFVLDGPPGDSAKPLAWAPCDADGNYLIKEICDDQGQNCQPIGAGTYWLAAVYDSNDDQQIDPKTGDAIGFHEGSPVTVPGATTTGLDVDVVLIQLMVQSIYVDTTLYVPQPVAVLAGLMVRAQSPVDGSVITDATVTAVDRAAGAFTLTYDAQEGAYVWSMQGGGAQFVTALDGDYTFTITHAAFGGAVARKMAHHPLTSAVAITAPVTSTQFAAPQDVPVTWTDPPAAVPSSLGVEEYKQNGQKVYSKPDQNGGPAPQSPETVPAAVFAPKGSYMIQVFSARTVFHAEGWSMEGAMGVSLISFK